MIRTSTVVYVVLLLGLVGAYLYLRNREEPADIELTAEPELQVSYLFTEEAGAPTSIRIEARAGETVEVVRDAEGAWALTEPIEAKANQGSAEAAASQITTMRVLDTVPDVDLDIVGLDDPEYVLTVGFADGGERTVAVGVMTPTESGYYVRDADGEVIIVSRSAIDALLGLLDNPPYLETPAVSPSPAIPESDAAVTATATP